MAIMHKYKHIYIAGITTIIIVILLIYASVRNYSNDINYNTYKMIENRIVSATIIDDYIYLKTEEANYKILKEMIDIKDLNKRVVIKKEDTIDSFDYLLKILIVILILFFIYLMFRGSKKSQTQQESNININQTIQNPIDTEKSYVKSFKNNIYFDDVAGIDDIKSEIFEIVDFLKNPIKYKNFGVKLPKGVLLVGPPGVGKTLIAKAMATEAGVPFFYHSGASFVQMYVGVGAKRVRELFADAKKNAPSIIFIDEIDAVAKSRGNYRNDERESTLNQLLTEIDGFEDMSDVIVIAATNKIELIDDAILRDGRFDRKIFIGLPSIDARKSILKLYLKDKANTVDIDTIAKLTVGFNGAALANLVNEASINAIKKDKNEITNDDFFDVRDKVATGKKSIIKYSDDEKKILAISMATKALFSYWAGMEFDKITLLGSGIKEIEREILSKSDIISKIRIQLSGMASLDVYRGEKYTISKDDIDIAKNLALDMVEKFGMGKSGILSQRDDATKILDEIYNELKNNISASKQFIDEIATILLDNESIKYSEIEKIIGL
jgi:ATP-dependent metalloprotease FtsH